MKLLRSCFRFEFRDIAFTDTASRHDNDASVSTLHQFGNQRNTFNGIRLLAGSQDTVASEFNQLFQCRKRVTADIKCPVAGYRQRFGSLHQSAHQRNIYISLFSEASENDAVYFQLFT